MVFSKAEKEAFVSGLGGTTIEEVAILSAAGTAGFLLRCSLLIASPSLYRKACQQQVVSFLIDFSLVILPGVLVFTVLSDYAVVIFIVELLAGLAMLFRTYMKSHTKPPSGLLEIQFPKRQPYLTLTRTTVNIFTAIAILAVDFRIFPRHLAKTETFGASLMDVGVGAFMMAHGVTSPEAREQKRNASGFQGYTGLIKGTAKGVLPLFALGLVRTIVLKTTGYQEHVTEYGVHWNFFLTIATVRLLCSILHPLLMCLPYGFGVAAVALATLYQFLLQQAGLEAFVLLGPNGDGSRIGLLSANREGVVSCVGYFVIYVGWIEIGRWLFKPRKVIKNYLVVLLMLSSVAVLLWAAANWSNENVHLISRRLVNISYILWIFSYGAFLLSIYLAYDIVILITVHQTKHPAPPLYQRDHTPDSVRPGQGQRRAPPPPPTPSCLISAVDYNQLVFFLLANVMTGVVNFFMDTLRAGPVLSVAVICFYMASLQFITTGLHSRKIKFKL